MKEISDRVRPGERVLCAVSGGADSMYLLARMLELAGEGGFQVLCAHYNHRLRGAESERDEAFVRAWCGEHAVPVFVGAYGGSRRDEAALREARYAFLRETAATQDCSWIATAHTADDQLETMLLHLARGAGLRGLSGIAPEQDGLLRPMLHLTRAEVEAWLTEHGVPHVEDSSNDSADYARNRLRREAVPAMKTVSADAARHAAETAALLREDEEYLRALALDVLAAQDGPGAALTDLRALPRPIRARVFRELFGAPLSRLHTERLHDFCFGDEPASLDLPGVRAVRERGRLFPESGLPPLPELSLTPGLDAVLPEHGLRVRVGGPVPAPEIYDSLTDCHFKSEKIRGTLILTARRPGDRIRLAGRGCTKRLSDLFCERGVPVAERDRVPVLRDEEGVAAVFGFGVAERLAPDPGEPCLTVTIESLS